MSSRVGVALLAAIAMLGLGATTASAAQLPRFLFAFGSDGTEATTFGSDIGAVAVDQATGATYVIDPDDASLTRFDGNGETLSNPPLPFSGSAPYLSENAITGLNLRNGEDETHVAVNSTSHDVYIADNNGQTLRAFEESGEPAVFTAGPGAGTNEISFAPSNPLVEVGVQGIAVDGTGDIYVSNNANGAVKVFTAAGEPLTEFAVSNPSNLAVNGSGTVYVIGEQRLVHAFTPSEYPVTSSTTYTGASEPFYPNGVYSIAIDSETNEVYLGQTPFNFQSALIAVYDQSGNSLGTFAGPGEAGQVGFPYGVAVFQLSGRVLVADFQDKHVKVFGPEIIPEGPPTIESIAVTGVTADSATLRAKINPNSFATEYQFEYGLEDCATSACVTIPASPGQIGGGHVPVAVAQHISGLLPGSVYHFRVVATNAKGDSLEKETDHTFTTQGTGLGFKLPDRRAWEMVSPPDKVGGRLVGISRGLIQSSVDGNGIAYLSIGASEPDPDGNRAFEASSVLAKRGADGAWTSKDITPPHGKVTSVAIGNLGEYKLFSSDLSKAVFQQRDTVPLSPLASERTPYLRGNEEPATYMPLLTGKGEGADVPAGIEFGGQADLGAGPVALVGANSDLSRIIMRSEVPLVAGGPPNAVYAWQAGGLQEVSVRPPLEGGDLVFGELGSGEGSVRHAVSEDGSRVFWETQDSKDLYMRDLETEESVRLDVVQLGGSDAKAAHPVFQVASADGSVVYFKDSQQLTPEAGSSGSDLYRCVISAIAPATGCSTLSNITGPLVSPGESSEVQGVVSAYTDDGRVLYFVAKGVLDDVPNQAGQVAVSGKANLYRWEEGQGARFIATLSQGDAPDWGTGVGRGASLAAAGSPSGRFFTFMSERSLTGYDNEDEVNDEPAQEVFLYDALADRLECISCNPSGAAPRARISELENVKPPLADQLMRWEGRLLAASLPEATVNSEAAQVSQYRPQSVFDSGRVFYNAYDALVPGDSNGQWDVYQYEPDGVGDCSDASAGASTAIAAGGCVSLISSGTAEQEAAFLDASANGDDAFFLSSARLSATDQDSVLDLYDARVDGIPATLNPITECAGEACQAVTGPPNDPTPASEAFNGPGNIRKKKCPHGTKKVHKQGKVSCVKPKHKKKQRRHRAASSSRGVQR